MRSTLARLAVVFAAAILALMTVAAAGAASDNSYVVHPLVSDNGVPGTVTDPNLVNAWGLTASSTSPWWVADNGTGVSTLYSGTGAIVPLVVDVGEAPTGTVFNNTTGFPLPLGTGNARFLFDTERGVISGWNGGPAAQTKITSTEGAVYKGLAIAQTTVGPRLYAADFHNRRVDVFDGSWQPVKQSFFSFRDPTIPRSFAPFGIQAIGSRIYVAYAKTEPGSDDEVAGPGLGFVDAFDAATGLLAAKVIDGQLNAPWGLAVAPANFGRFSGDLLVGNFGDGRINAFKPILGGLLYLPHGQLRTPTGDPVTIDGLWALEFGNGAGAGPSTSLFFTAGPGEEEHGLFGSITTG
jgi:uncharacterized protein (TIGR03118 family)